jgi:Sulfotransferase family
MLLYRRRSPAAGKPRWGFKEVRCDAGHARLLLEAFPDGCIVFLLRDPVSIIASMRGASGYESWYEYAGGARGVLARWARQTESFLDLADPRVLIVRYDVLVAQPATEMARIARHIEVAKEWLDLGVFDHVVRGVSGAPRIEPREVLELHRPAIRRAAARAGYPDPARDPRTALARGARTLVEDLGALPARVSRAVKRRLPNL